jgi:hypothetical protein
MARVSKLGTDPEPAVAEPATGTAPRVKPKQVNPTITPELDARINRLARHMRTDKMTIVNASLEYGAWNFKKAWKRYLRVREALIEDDDDTTAAVEADAGNVVKLTPPNVKN